MAIRVMPVRGTFKYGYRYGVPTYYSKFHLGVDYGQPVGSPLDAVEDGKILYTGYGSQGGWTVHLQCDSGVFVRYLHCKVNSILVKAGQRVKAGQQIAEVGNTGALSKSPHLHFDTWRVTDWTIADLNTKRGLFDPEPWLKQSNNGGDFMNKPTEEQAKQIVKKVIYGFPGAGLLARAKDPEIADSAAFKQKVGALLAAGDNWIDWLSAEASGVVKSPEFKDIRIGVK